MDFSRLDLCFGNNSMEVFARIGMARVRLFVSQSRPVGSRASGVIAWDPRLPPPAPASDVWLMAPELGVLKLVHCRLQ
jgi:hypothetical protein